MEQVPQKSGNNARKKLRFPRKFLLREGNTIAVRLDPQNCNLARYSNTKEGKEEGSRANKRPGKTNNDEKLCWALARLSPNSQRTSWRNASKSNFHAHYFDSDKARRSPLPDVPRGSLPAGWGEEMQLILKTICRSQFAQPCDVLLGPKVGIQTKEVS